MQQELLERLSKITPEEEEILKGSGKIDRSIYMNQQGSLINADKLLSAGKLITLRPHTRFIRFPAHTHDFVEMIYMCSGKTHHIINGESITLNTGELLFLNQHAVQEILKADKNDIAVNFIILPEFFKVCLDIIGEEQTPLRRFLLDCLCGKSGDASYLHFKASGISAVQNLAENLIIAQLSDSQNKRKISQITMSALFLELINHSDALNYNENKDSLMIKILSYVETHYANGSLSLLCEKLHYNNAWLSRYIKQNTGKTFTTLMTEKRLAQAGYLLKNTNITVNETALAVGYENISFFHRIFTECYGMTPKKYRDSWNNKT